MIIISSNVYHNSDTFRLDIYNPEFIADLHGYLSTVTSVPRRFAIEDFVRFVDADSFQRRALVRTAS